MRAGQLRERIRFESKLVGRDAIGGETVTWKDRGEVWAAVEPAAGREANIASQIQAITTLKVTCRRRTDIDQTWRIHWQCQVLSIEAVLPDPKRQKVTLLCSQGLNKADRG